MAAFIFSGISLLALLFHLLWPALALAQESKAGVVTTIHGAASVARVAVPQEIPLKLKDDVLYRDRITTKEQSIVRVLLGGKALVTVRELSVLTITEEPGRATVEVHSGKIALAVARKLLRPGEYIEIRTPTAVAAVRGTVVIIEVIPAVLGALATTLVNVLNGLVAVSLPQAPTVPAVTVSAGQSLPVTSTGFGQVGPVSPTATQGLTPPSSPPTGSPAADQIGANQTAQATAIALALTPPTPTPPPPVVSTPSPSTSSVGVNETIATIATESSPPPPPPPPPAPTGSLFLASDVTLQMDKNTSLATFSAGTAQNPQAGAIVCATPPCPPVLLTTPVVTGQAPGSTMISVSGPNGTPVIELKNSTLTATTAPVAPLFRVNGVDLTTTTPLVVDPSSVTVGGPLYDSVSANVTITGAGGLQPVTRLLGGSTLQNTAGPVFRIVGGSLMADALGISDGSGNTFNLTGTLLDLTNTQVTLRTLGEDVSGTDTDIAKFTLGVNEPLIDLKNSQLTLTGAGKTLVDYGVDTGSPVNQGGVALAMSGMSSLSVKGRLLDFGGVNLTDPNAQIQISNSTVTQTGSDPLIDIFGLPVTMAGPLLYVGGGSTVIADGPVVRFGAGSFMSNTINNFVEVGNGDSVKSGKNFFLFDNGADVTLNGRLLQTFFSTLCSGSTATPCAAGGTSSFVTVTGGASLRTELSPLFTSLVALFGGSVTAGGNFLNVSGAGSKVQLTGRLLDALVSTITAGNNLVRIADGGSFSSNISTGDALILFQGGSYTGGGTLGTSSGGSLLRMFSQTGQPGTSLTLDGGFLTSSGGTTFVSKDGPMFDIADGATIKTTADIAFASFAAGGMATSASHFFSLANNTSFTLPAPNVTIRSTLISGGFLIFTTQNGGDFLHLRNGVTLDQTVTTSALVTLAGNASITGEGHFLSMSAASRPAPSLTLGGSLLSAIGTVLTNGDPTANVKSFIFIGDSATLTGPPPAAGGVVDLPLLSFDNSAVDTAGAVLELRRSPAEAASVLTLSGPLFSATNGSTFNTTSLGFGPAFGTAGTSCCPGFFIGQGAQLEAATTDSLINLTNSTFNAGLDGQSGGNFFEVSDVGPPDGIVAPASVALGSSTVRAGSLLTATDSQITALFDLVSVTRSTLTTNGTGPLVELVRGSLTLGGVDPFTGQTVDAALFNLKGAGIGDIEVVEGVTLNLGPDQPLSHTDPNGFPAPLFQTTDATVSAPKALKIDTALLVATAPLFNFLNGGGGGSDVTFTNADPNAGVLDLSMKAKVTSLGSALVMLDGSIVRVLNGHFVNVAGGSLLSVAGDLVHLMNGSTLIISNGTLLNVTGTSVAQIGTLIRFSNSPGNTSLSNITVTNTIAPNSLLGTFPIFVASGGTLNVTNATPIVGLGTSGTVTVTSGGSLLAVAAGSVLRIGP